jgi:hypothetical protein
MMLSTADRLTIDLAEIERRFELRHFPLAVRLGLSWPLWLVEIRPDRPWAQALPVTRRRTVDPREPVTVEVIVEVPDRDTGQPVGIRFCEMMRAEWFADDGRWPHELRRMIVRMMTHEVDEAIHVDGVRRFDPHAREHR